MQDSICTSVKCTMSTKHKQMSYNANKCMNKAPKGQTNQMQASRDEENILAKQFRNKNRDSPKSMLSQHFFKNENQLLRNMTNGCTMSL